jgi:hypothetical protein
LAVVRIAAAGDRAWHMIPPIRRGGKPLGLGTGLAPTPPNQGRRASMAKSLYETRTTLSAARTISSTMSRYWEASQTGRSLFGYRAYASRCRSLNDRSSSTAVMSRKPRAFAHSYHPIRS